jgi:Protein of unknown function (DUF2442)
MSELRIRNVSFSEDTMTVRFSDGREIAVPLSYFPRLQAGSAAERNEWSLIGRGLGLHWEALDEDLSVENILTAYSRHQRAAYAHSAHS